MTASCSHSCCRQDFLPLACGLLPAEGREVACETPAAAALRGCGCVAQATALDLTGVEAQPAWPYQPTHSAPSSTGRLPRCAMYGATSRRTFKWGSVECLASLYAMPLCASYPP
jgi:hypothetical protein